jgi:predicted ATPase
MSRPDDAISEIQGGIEEARRSNLGYMRGFMLGWLASVLAETGEREAAMATVDDAIKGTDDVSGRAWESELHRLRGTILLAAHVGVHDDSERCFNKAIAAARRQGARSLELRATTELSRLWQGQGKTRQARDLLAPVHDWFTEGLDTADLKEAKALLEDLS